MNIELLRKVQAAILEHPKKFDMDNFFTIYPEDFQPGCTDEEGIATIGNLSCEYEFQNSEVIKICNKDNDTENTHSGS